MLEYSVFRLLSWLAPRLPPSVAYKLFGWIGDISYWVLPRRRANVRRNLSMVLRGGTEGLGQLIRETFREGARYYYDTFRVPALTDEELEATITLRGWEHLEKGLEGGKGVVLVTAHLGSPVLVAQILAVRRCRVVSVVEAVNPPQLLELMTRARGSRGIRLVPLGPSIFRVLNESLARNEIVGLVADRDLQGSGVRAEFFGAETVMPSGPVTLALRTGAALVPAFTYRRRDGGFLARIEEPLSMTRTGKLKEDVRLNTQRLAAVLEKAIAEKPEQWIVFESVWPEGAAEDRFGAAS